MQFHSELNPIERCWAKAKQYARAHCDYSFPSLQRIAEQALDSITLDQVRKHFRKVRDYHRAYMAGKNALEAETKVWDEKWVNMVWLTHRFQQIVTGIVTFDPLGSAYIHMYVGQGLQVTQEGSNFGNLTTDADRTRKDTTVNWLQKGGGRCACSCV